MPCVVPQTKNERPHKFIVNKRFQGLAQGNGTTRGKPCKTRRVFESVTPSMVKNFAAVTQRANEDETRRGIRGNPGD